MKNDKRKVSTDALETLGTLIDETAKRDAIHLAVEPVIAGENLAVGADVGIELSGVASARPDITKLGIVDPFLKKAVKKGEKFWLIVYPRTITSLRHVWSHPAFKEAEESMDINPEQEEAIKWVNNFANILGTNYMELMNGADNYFKRGDYLHMGDNETYSDYYHEMEKFWDNYETIRGVKVKQRGGFFSCSC